LKGDERKEAEKNNEAARRWISGFLEGTLFHWAMLYTLTHSGNGA
jgi:hypothetical protein